MAGITGKSGGARTGAGRKRSQVGKIKKQIRISPDVFAHYQKEFGNTALSDVLEAAYRSAFNLPKSNIKDDQ
jgi:hypothetical protein